MLAALLRGTAAPAAVVGGTACMHTLSAPRQVKQRQKAATCSAISHACWQQAHQQQQQPAGLSSSSSCCRCISSDCSTAPACRWKDILAEHRQHQQQLLHSGWPCMRQLPRCFAAAAAQTQGDCLQHGWHSSSSSSRAGVLLCQPYSKLSVISSNWAGQNERWRHRWYAVSAQGCSADYVLDYVHIQHPSMQQSSSAPAVDHSKRTAGQNPVHQSPSAAPAAAPSAGVAAAGAIAPCAPGNTPTVGPADPSAGPRGRVAAVAVSGGVDSIVSALLLKQQGYQMFGVYKHTGMQQTKQGQGHQLVHQQQIWQMRRLCARRSTYPCTKLILCHVAGMRFLRPSCRV